MTYTLLFLQLTIIPVNDAPILSFTNSNNQEMYSYTEDDPPINIGGNILLIDVDSSIMSVSLSLTSEYGVYNRHVYKYIYVHTHIHNTITLCTNFYSYAVYVSMFILFLC